LFNKGVRTADAAVAEGQRVAERVRRVVAPELALLEVVQEGASGARVMVHEGELVLVVVALGVPGVAPEPAVHHVEPHGVAAVDAAAPVVGEGSDLVAEADAEVVGVESHERVAAVPEGELGRTKVVAPLDEPIEEGLLSELEGA
jgi:hypothetical protein